MVCYAAGHDKEEDARRAVFDAYMLRTRDIGRVDVLVDLAGSFGLDTTETKAVLDVDRYEARVDERRRAAATSGVRTTPSVVSGSRRMEGFHNGDALGTFLHL